MSLRLILSAAAVLTLSVPAHAALAQDAAATASAPVEELDMEEASAQFEKRVEEMKVELEALVDANAENPQSLPPKIDAVTARYQPDFNAFSDTMDTFFAGEIAKAETPEKRQELETARAQVIPMLRSLPAQIRAAVMQSIQQAD